METIKFKVTRKDLRHKYTAPWSCPIYQALKRILPEANIAVGTSCVFINNEEFYLLSKYDKLARKRAQTLWGQIIGGFKCEITKIV